MASTTPPQTSHKNILLLIADDLGRNLGCYGDLSIKTPNIDTLAAQGVLFTHAFTSTASCSNSRSVIYTGLHTHQSGQYGLAGKAHHFVIFDHIQTAPALFNAAGYLTGLIGKIHVGPIASYPWTICQESSSRDVAWVADEAGKFFEQANNTQKPFFLTVGYIDPHRDMTRSGFGNAEQATNPRVRSVRYDRSKINIPSYINDIDEARLEFAEYFESISRLDQGVGLILEELRLAGREKNTLVVFLSDNGPPFLNSKTTLYDAGVNLPFIVRQPDQSQKPDDNTNTSTTTTTTTSNDKGIINPNMISYIDILPTFLDWANIKPPVSQPLPNLPSHSLTGRSILPILTETNILPSSSDWPHHVFGSHTFHEVTNYWPTRFLRTRRYKYHRNVAWRLDFPFSADLYGSLTWEGIRNSGPAGSSRNITIGKRLVRDYFFRPPEELYDLENDPDEIHNLASDESYRTLLLEFRARLEQWQRDTGDPWLYRDGVSLRFIKHHLDAGMVVPDRFDLDIDNLRNLPEQSER
ncbi:N-sulfoglucosamine sulfohydrolase [Exophiala dermatitidis]